MVFALTGRNVVFDGEPEEPLKNLKKQLQPLLCYRPFYVNKDSIYVLRLSL